MKKLSPEEILEDFFHRHTALAGEREKADVLFRFVQYVERQIVLFDALEDAAFRHVNDMGGVGTLKHLMSEVIQGNKEEELTEKLKDYYLYHAVLGDFEGRLEHNETAASHFRRALELAESKSERVFLEGKLMQVSLLGPRIPFSTKKV